MPVSIATANDAACKVNDPNRNAQGQWIGAVSRGHIKVGGSVIRFVQTEVWERTMDPMKEK